MRFIVALLVCLVSVPAQATWYKVETDKFIFYGTSPKSLQEDALRLERFDALLRHQLSIPEPQNEAKLSVFVLSGQGEVRKVYGEGAKGVAGFYRASEAGVWAVVPRDSSDFDDIILNHEYAHHLMLHHFTTAYPAWYVEGFAEFLSTVEFKGDKANIGLQATHRLYDLRLEDTTPIRKLLSYSVSEIDRDQRGNFYGRAWLLTHFLSFKKERKGQLEKYLALVNKGTPSLVAAEETFGDLNVLQRELQRYMEARSIYYLGIPFPPPVKGLTMVEMEPAFGETLRERLSLNRHMEDDERQSTIQSLERAVLNYPKSAAVWALLAEAKLDAKDYTGAIAASDTAISVDAQMPRANLWRGLAQLRDLQDKSSDDVAAWKAARGWLIRANRADPEDALILFEYYRSFGRERRAPSVAAIAGLRKASLKIPQAERLRLAYAFELMKSGEYGEAADYLQPLANSPHGGDAAKKLQTVVGKLRAAAADKSRKFQLSDFMDELGGEAIDL